MAEDLLLVRAAVMPAPGQEQVEQTIPVVVDYGQPAAERLQDRQVRRLDFLAVAVGEVDSRARGHVLEEVGADGIGIGW